MDRISLEVGDRPNPDRVLDPEDILRDTPISTDADDVRMVVGVSGLRLLAGSKEVPARDTASPDR